MRMNCVSVSPYHDDFFSRNFEQEVIALVGDSADVVGVLPLAGKQMSEFFVEYLGRKVESLFE
jgi:hypothetical protein